MQERQLLNLVRKIGSKTLKIISKFLWLLLYFFNLFEPVMNLYAFAELPGGGLILHIEFAFPKLNGK